MGADRGGPPDGSRDDDAASRLDGNRSWRIDTPRGAVLQKLYVERAGAVRGVVRDALIAVMGTKTSARAAARRATERRLLATWRAAGFDVPRDLTDEFPELGGDRVAVFEFVEGRPLYDVLAREGLAGAPRAEILLRFAADWGRRHVAALRGSDSNDRRAPVPAGSCRISSRGTRRSPRITSREARRSSSRWS